MRSVVILFSIFVGIAALTFSVNASAQNATPPSTPPSTPPQSSTQALPQNEAEQRKWPAELTERFMIKCANYNKQLIPYCQCVFVNMRRAIAFHEFKKMAISNQYLQDQRYLKIRNACVHNPAARY